MVIMKNKKGISPIIATVLLIVIAIALFVIVFLWIRSFQGEQLEKFNAPIENSCPNIQLQLTIIGTDLQIENIGNVPVYKIQLFSVEQGSSTKINEEEINLKAGETTSINLGTSCIDSIKIIPVLLGTTKSGAQKEYICENKEIITSC